MGKKLEDLSGWELAAALVQIAEPVGNLVNDEQFWEAFKECTRQAVRLRQKDTLRFLLKGFAKLTPILLSEEHRWDTVQILAVVEGVPVDTVMKKKGSEIILDIRRVVNDTLVPFFTKSVRSDRPEQSSR